MSRLSMKNYTRRIGLAYCIRTMNSPLLLMLLLLLGLVASASFCSQQAENEVKKRFWIANDMFWKDEEPFRILGGDVHYFRIHPEYWEDRLLRAKALGLNTIQTYVAWNIHEPRQGELHFEGSADLESFLKVAQKLELLVMLRIGPYICAEWDFGGFPAWLLAHQPQLRLRSADPAYLNLVDSWWDVLLPKIAPLLYENGGPVIMVQVENEFGSYGKDTDYLEHLVEETRFHLGHSIIIYTTDGGSKGTLENGTLRGDDVYSAVDFPIDWDAAQVFALQKTFNARGKSPSMITEFYTGWLTHWRENMMTTDSAQTAAALDKILSLNASAVLYMAHGGTNFGFFSGANTGTNSSDYKADVTSYDYDAPISEAGDLDHAKFLDLRRVFAKHSRMSLPEPPLLPLRMAYGKVKLEKIASLFHVLQHVSVPPHGMRMQEPCMMESLNQISGFILYQTVLPAHSRPGSALLIPKLHDRAQVFIQTEDSEQLEHCYVGIIERWSNQHLTLPSYASAPGLRLEILVENMGRVNYGPFVFDPKGILSSVLLDGVPILGWTTYSISLDNVSTIINSKIARNLQPQSFKLSAELRNSINLHSNSTCKSEYSEVDVGFFFGVLQINERADSFLSLRGWTKGVAFVNGFNLGRYWTNVGPQCTLYIPAPLLRPGLNELIIFELEQPPNELHVEFVHRPNFTCGLRQNSHVSMLPMPT